MEVYIEPKMTTHINSNISLLGIMLRWKRLDTQESVKKIFSYRDIYNRKTYKQPKYLTTLVLFYKFWCVYVIGILDSYLIILWFFLN